MLMRVKIKVEAPQDTPESSSEGDDEETMVVPKAAIAGEGENVWVWVINATPTTTQASKRVVALGGDDEDGYIVVRSGLKPGDRVIVNAPEALADNARVKVMGERLPQSDE
jgi:multidrug efflux pump subunit AcrA (membrane-fusion protein)